MTDEKGEKILNYKKSYVERQSRLDTDSIDSSDHFH